MFENVVTRWQRILFDEQVEFSIECADNKERRKNNDNEVSKEDVIATVTTKINCLFWKLNKQSMNHNDHKKNVIE